MAKKTGLAQATTQKKAPLTPDEWVGSDKSKPTDKGASSRLVVDIPAELHKRLKGKCALEGITIRDVVRSILEKYLDN